LNSEPSKLLQCLEGTLALTAHVQHGPDAISVLDTATTLSEKPNTSSNPAGSNRIEMEHSHVFSISLAYVAQSSKSGPLADFPIAVLLVAKKQTPLSYR
jgi:hypothetical protein